MFDFQSLINNLTAIGQAETPEQMRARLDAQRRPLGLADLHALTMQAAPSPDLPAAGPLPTIEQESVGTSPSGAGTINANGIGLRAGRRSIRNSLGILA
ncbi:hypothetical protein ACNFH8_08210 [Pseudomonas sp. NY15436]|uniref:hypothetical protein n=1 Tax=Pseudomonas sp. NY15436 TaxID=3400359 RepID=UPI003A8C12BB